VSAVAALRDRAASLPAWLPSPGEDRPPGLLFTRSVRLRNFAGLPFWVSASAEACARITERAQARAAARGFGEDLRLTELSANARGVLRERGLLPGNPAAFDGKRDFKRLFLGADARAHALLGEAEHWIEVRVSAGFAAGAADSPDALDESAFSRSPEYGTLTSDPGFAGLGLRLEAGLHLPGLVAERGIAAAGRALGVLGFELQPLALRVAGCAEAGFFRLLSRGGLGLTEAELREHFAAKTGRLLDAEAAALERWRARDPGRFEDAAHRAAGLLRSAARAEYAELLSWISRVRAGRRAGWLGDVPETALEALRVRAQPHHLALENPGAIPGDESGLRARLARTLLAE
jgi:protein-arginine kinase